MIPQAQCQSVSVHHNLVEPMTFHLLVLSPVCNPARVYPCTANIILIVYPIAGVHILGLYMGYYFTYLKIPLQL